MSIFGWDYPPGCSATPYDEDNLSPIREELWQLLEDGQVPFYLIELVDTVVASLEAQLDVECDRCQAEALKHEQLLWEYASQQQNSLTVESDLHSCSQDALEDLV
jgi:hypothetical protein